MTTTVTAVMPTMGRPEQAAACIRQMFATAGTDGLDCIAVVECDTLTPQYLAGIPNTMVIQRAEHRGAVYGWNEGAAHSFSNAFVLAADDLVWGQDWLVKALAHVGNGIDFVGFNDGNRNDFATHFLATRQHLIEVQGGVLAIPTYRHYCFDPEMTARAKAVGRYVWAEDVDVAHRHVDYGLAPMDDTYRMAKGNIHRDYTVYLQRMKHKFPTDYEPVLQQVKEDVDERQ